MACRTTSLARSADPPPVAAGLLTPGVLRGPRYRRLFPDVYAPADAEPDLALRAHAAGVLVRGRGVVAGHAAAELLGASSRAPDSPVDVLVPYSYRCAGLRVHRGRLPADERARVGPTPVTTPTRTTFDLARWAPSPTERVAAVDALAHCCGVDVDAVRVLRNRHLGVRRADLVPPVLALVDGRAESVMESRVRMALHLGGLPAPAVQHPVSTARPATAWTSPTHGCGSRSSTTEPTTAGSAGRAGTCCARRT